MKNNVNLRIKDKHGHCIGECRTYRALLEKEER